MDLHRAKGAEVKCARSHTCTLTTSRTEGNLAEGAIKRGAHKGAAELGGPVGVTGANAGPSTH